MDYIVVTGKILTLGKIENREGASSSYEFIEFKSSSNSEAILTDRVFASANFHPLLEEGSSGKFVFTKAKKITTLIGVKIGKKEATIFEHVSLANIKAMKALKTMSTIGLLAVALGVTHLISEGMNSNGLLFTLFGTLFTAVTVSQPILIERQKKKHADYLKEEGFDVTAILRQMEPGN